MKDSEIKKAVREGYAKAAKQGCGCGPAESSCCGDSTKVEKISEGIGYSDAEMSAVPDGANLGLGCGNPTALASLRQGETVLDLGSGAGFDCFLAAKKVGKAGAVIGVDMTPEMIDKARANAQKGGFDNVEFRLGEIENLPAADGQVDVVISNCVINLAPDKDRVFSEGFRVLKPGGRMMISDIVLLKELPEQIKNSVDNYVGCISGSIMKDVYLSKIKKAGFVGIEIMAEKSFSLEFLANDPTATAIIKDSGMTAEKLADQAVKTIASISVSARKPRP
jgi:SAM-dependent methyltransferase